MPTVISSFVTVTCDGADCPNTATFPQTEQGEREALAEYVWMQSMRFVQCPDGRKFTYCSDSCEAQATGQGIHNKQVIVPAQNSQSVDLAAQAALRAKQATDALKSGQAKVQLS